MIRAAVRVGFSLAELAEILKERRAGGAPCKKVASFAAAHLQEFNDRIAELTRLRNWLALTLDSWNTRLKTLKPGEQARFLDGLPNPEELNSMFQKGSTHEQPASNRNPLPRRSQLAAPRSRLNANARAQRRP
jgi:hypothetical protein